MLAADDPELTAHARFLSQQARDPAPHYEHSTVGYNYRMSNIVAAIGLAQLEVLDDRVRRRREVFACYRERLGSMPGLTFMPEAAYGRASRWLTVVTIEPDRFGSDREDVRQALERANIEARPVWKPMHLQPLFQDAACVGGEVSERLFAQGLCLPSGSQMSTADIERVVAVITACARHPAGGRVREWQPGSAC
jgi:pyridoxal phosphate-dependent aminotransferase EpsN